MVTRRQQQIWEVIQSLHARLGYPPTLDEIARASGIATRSTIHQHVQALIREGRLLASTGKRAYRLPDERTVQHAPSGMNLPLMGRIAAGKPIEAIPDRTDINPNELFVGHDRYVLQVRGESMID
ncbi:MAG: LexA family protein, partial [Thiothrix sp.]